jgi:hypothetical protein
LCTQNRGILYAGLSLFYQLIKKGIPVLTCDRGVKWIDARAHTGTGTGTGTGTVTQTSTRAHKSQQATQTHTHVHNRNNAQLHNAQFVNERTHNKLNRHKYSKCALCISEPLTMPAHCRTSLLTMLSYVVKEQKYKNTIQ